MNAVNIYYFVARINIKTKKKARLDRAPFFCYEDCLYFFQFVVCKFVYVIKPVYQTFKFFSRVVAV